MTAVAPKKHLRKPKAPQRASILDVLPQQGDWTEEEYLWLSGRTNHLIEYTAGFIEVLPIPTDFHQRISKYLLFALTAFIQHLGGDVMYSPLRLRLPSGKFREPDLLLLLDANDPRRSDAFWTGADLVVEIVSPDDPRRDTVQKRKDYAQARIPEYWIVNPLDETITVLTLDGSTYAEHGIFTRGDTATSVLLADFSVSVDATFDR